MLKSCRRKVVIHIKLEDVVIDGSISSIIITMRSRIERIGQSIDLYKVWIVSKRNSASKNSSRGDMNDDSYPRSNN